MLVRLVAPFVLARARPRARIRFKRKTAGVLRC